MSEQETPALFRPGIGKRGMNEAHYAAYCGDYNALLSALNAGIDPNAKDQYRGYTTTHWLADMASAGGPRLQMLSLLLQRSADLGIVSDSGDSILSLARASGSATGDALVDEILKVVGNSE